MPRIAQTAKKLALPQITYQESDPNRLRERIDRVISLDPNLPSNTTERLIQGDVNVLEHLEPQQRSIVTALTTDDSQASLEKIWGPTTDFFPVAYLDIARAAANTVARVVSRRRQAIGSGFMISERLFMTNNHVTNLTNVENQLLQFGYELDTKSRQLIPTEFALDPTACFLTVDENDLDFTIIAVGQRVSGLGELEDFGFCPLSDATDKHADGDFVNIVQHPNGDPKQIVVRENHVIGRGIKGITLHYGTDTLGGSSGSPAFNDEYEVIALHHSGGPWLDKTLENGQTVSKESNEGVRISAIVKRLRQELPGLPPQARSLLENALKDRGFRSPSKIGGTASPEQVFPFPPKSKTTTNSEPQINEDGRVTWTIPIELSVRLPIGTNITKDTIQTTDPSPSSVTPDDTVTAERNQKPDHDYSNRQGYDADFLGVNIPLPKLSSANLKQAAQNQQPNRPDKTVLDYHHFSLVLNARRRTAFFTAVNINGAQAVDIGRERLENALAEASERWYEDPRVDDHEELVQSIFANQQPRMFDRGHLVRRLDPVWGDLAQEANDDTFHFCNCSLQHKDFNQSRNLWLGLESFILSKAIADKAQITVFTGPVFGKSDPPYRGLRVPKQFWKVLVRRQGGKLKATGFVVDQSKLLTNLPEAKTNFNPETFQRRLEEIEKLTGLDFGDLKKADTTKAAEGLERMRALSALSEASW
jgi:endonuclease G, mitochondrial